MRSTITASALLLACALLQLPAHAQQGGPVAQDYNGTPYISGGVGDTERQQLDQVSKDYNLKLILAERSGSYLAQVDVTILDAKGAKVLEAPSVGPFLLVKLPPGNYRVSATYEGKTLNQRIAVPSRGQQTREFYW